MLMLNNQYFKSFADAMVLDDQEDQAMQMQLQHSPLIATEIGEYIENTPIYYGATIALQARHGGYLSYNNTTEIKASAHKILLNTRLMIKKSDDLTDVSMVKYGDAIWLQTGTNMVLGERGFFDLKVVVW